MLTIAGLKPGMLLDSLLLTNINITTNIVTFYLTVTNVVTNSLYLTFTENTNLTTTPIKFAIPPFVPPITTPTILFTNGFEGLPPSDYVTNRIVSGWTVLSNQVSVVADPTNAYDGSNSWRWPAAPSSRICPPCWDKTTRSRSPIAGRESPLGGGEKAMGWTPSTATPRR